jgi:hypothetical protein
VVPETTGDAGAAARGRDGSEQDTRSISASEQQKIEDQTAAILAAKGSYQASTTVNVPVYFHVMTDTAGNGDVTDKQIAAQVKVLNDDFAGREGRVPPTPASPSRWPEWSASPTTPGTPTRTASSTGARPARAERTR